MRRIDSDIRTNTPAYLILAALAFGVVFIRWGGELTEMHVFRQSQTALSVYWMLRDGISLLLPPLPVFGIENPSIPMEFPLYHALATLLAHVMPGSLLEKTLLACRIVNFASFLGAAYAFMRIVRRYWNSRVGNIALAFFLFLPFPMGWAGVVSIEYLSLALVLVYCELLLRLFLEEEFDWRLVALAMVIGSLAMLSKITTALIYGPAVALLWYHWVFRAQLRPTLIRAVVTTLCVAIVPFLIGYAWTHWSDSVKAQSPLTYFLTSAGSAEWNFGTVRGRLSPGGWAKIGSYWFLQVFAVACIPLVVAGVVHLWKQDRTKLLLLALPPITALAVFFNLYMHHNYYHLAILPSLIVVIAVGFEALFHKLDARRATYLGAAFLVGSWAFMGLQTLIPHYDTAYALLSEFRFVHQKRHPDRIRDLIIVDDMKKFTKPDDVTLVAVDNWPATIPLLAERRVVMASECENSLKPHPHLDYYAVDRQRSPCHAFQIPPRCKLDEKDGISFGTCLDVKN